MTIINQSNYDTKEIKRLTRIALSRLKKALAIPPLDTIIVQSYHAKSWQGNYDGKSRLTIRIGDKVRFPNTWDRVVTLCTWEDLYVALFTWCAMLHFQKAVALKGKVWPYPKVKYSRAECQEMTVRTIQRWRVDSEMKLIMEKAGF